MLVLSTCAAQSLLFPEHRRASLGACRALNAAAGVFLGGAAITLSRLCVPFPFSGGASMLVGAVTWLMGMDEALPRASTWLALTALQWMLDGAFTRGEFAWIAQSVAAHVLASHLTRAQCCCCCLLLATRPKPPLRWSSLWCRSPSCMLARASQGILRAAVLVALYTWPVVFLLRNRGPSPVLLLAFAVIAAATIALAGLQWITARIGQVALPALCRRHAAQDSLAWMGRFIAARAGLAVYWWALLLAAVAAMHPASPLRTARKLVQRKYFHIVAAALFIPVHMCCAAAAPLMRAGGCGGPRLLGGGFGGRGRRVGGPGGRARGSPARPVRPQFAFARRTLADTEQ